ncbi:50S ribosomal protein L25/general stress protein Ctc [Micromonospora sediminimaris]|uniref:Large ribosomal subunit protein bL25 n=1 Tax=Micromonospora sediminimaris TaxID=547162 RepID=A0A9W5UQE7_9ACTN|nr:50S ribosomal protein L25/general stress protein Ctc [Micromonospora sediminimaris]GIJ32348.1 50S ribosomal protein L25 [Micromonospora sediminimaris]SFD33271.1 large subunit ribosomal protein L25 [Micromonospora sediminimaris]
MSEVKISAEPRTEFGKGGARRTRRAGMVPAVLYGHGEKPKHIALPAREFAAAIRNGGANQLLALDISDGTQALALPKAIQRDPIKDTFEHVDLLLVRRGEKVTVDVPVQLTGEAARDTLIVHDHDTLSVSADATKVPDHLEASIEGAEPGSQVTAADVTLPAGVELAGDPQMLIASITAAPTAEQLESTLPEVEEATEEAEAEVGEVTEGAAEAPSAEGEAGTEARTEA